MTQEQAKLKPKTCLDFTNDIHYTDERRDKCRMCGYNEPEHDADWEAIRLERLVK